MKRLKKLKTKQNKTKNSKILKIKETVIEKQKLFEGSDDIVSEIESVTGRIAGLIEMTESEFQVIKEILTFINSYLSDKDDEDTMYKFEDEQIKLYRKMVDVHFLFEDNKKQINLILKTLESF